jgi:hypothetical protein
MAMITSQRQLRMEQWQSLEREVGQVGNLPYIRLGASGALWMWLHSTIYRSKLTVTRLARTANHDDEPYLSNSACSRIRWDDFNRQRRLAMKS